MTEEVFDQIKGAGDAVAVVVTIGTVASLLPPVAAFVTIVWTVIRIYETKTVQGVIAYIRGD